MTIGQRIRLLRKQNNLLQEELGKKIGVARQTVASWEADRTLPNMKAASKMSTVTDEATVLELGGWKTTNIFKNTYRYALPENVDKAKQDATNLIKDLI